MQATLETLRRLASRAENRRTETGVPGLAMVRGEIPEHRLTGVYEPMINLILQGGKTLTIGAQTLHFDPASYFISSIDAPATGMVHEDGPARPYLAVSLSLEATALSALLAELPPRLAAPGSQRGYSVCPVTPELLDAWARLMQLMDRPEDIPVLAPAYEREILYRVLQGPQGWLLRSLATPDSTIARIRLAIHEIRRNYAEPIRVEQLASRSAMSVSAFHRRFKAVTGMSPIQFQKRLRLVQARSLLVAGAAGAAQAAFEVGYESASQFSREYARLFDCSPAADAARIRTELGASSDGAEIVAT